MNWGKYLMLGMGTFMAFIISMGVYMLTQTKDEYDKQYYEKGLNYDEEYTRQKQTITDNAQPVVTVNGNEVNLNFNAAIKGKVYLTRPADRQMDKTFVVESTDAKETVSIPTAQLAKGEWKLRAEWVSHQTNYLYEQPLHIK